jgi:hypothetical protein
MNDLMSFGRKFWASIFGIIMLTVMIIFFVKYSPQAITPSVIIIYLSFVFFLVLFYIASNIVNKWVTGLVGNTKINIGRG